MDLHSILTLFNDTAVVRGVVTGLALLFVIYLFGLLVWYLPQWLSTSIKNRSATSWGNMLVTGKVGEIADWFIWRFTAFGMAGIAFAALAAWIEGGYPLGTRVLGLSVLFGAASTCAGWLLGLLFGVPRTLARDQNARPAPAPSPTAPAGGQPAAAQPASGATAGQATPATAASGAAAPTPPDQEARANASRANGTNTNLEDISDWLTKTIVGVGLTQLYSVPHFLWSKAGQLNELGFGWDKHGQLLALSLFVYFASGGFWLGYVGTRTVLTALLNMVDSGAYVINNFSFDDTDANIQKLQDYVLAADKKSLDPQKTANVVNEMRALGVGDVSLPTFLNSLDFSRQRAQVVQRLHIP